MELLAKIFTVGLYVRKKGLQIFLRKICLNASIRKCHTRNIRFHVVFGYSVYHTDNLYHLLLKLIVPNQMPDRYLGNENWQKIEDQTIISSTVYTDFKQSRFLSICVIHSTPWYFSTIKIFSLNTNMLQQGLTWISQVDLNLLSVIFCLTKISVLSFSSWLVPKGRLSC